jgi:hypothetical protein
LKLLFVLSLIHPTSKACFFLWTAIINCFSVLLKIFITGCDIC